MDGTAGPRRRRRDPRADGLDSEYEDLAALFREVLGQPYSREDYVRQFTIRVPENLAKLQRVERFHRTQVADAPPVLFEVLAEQRRRLEVCAAKGDYVSPLDL